VSVENGCLRIKNSRLNPTEDNDGKFRFTIHPGTKYNPQPFARPMYMHMVTGRQGRQPMGAAAPLITKHCQKVNDLSG
jgi:hypothetical protein